MTDQDFYTLSSSEAMEYVGKHQIVKLADRNKYDQSQYQVTHGCGHTEVIGSWCTTGVSFVKDSMASELELCENCSI